MNKFEIGLLRYITPEKLELIQSKKIGIAGCGGLGSNIANALVRSGFKHFELVDRDVIDESNLNRQNYFIDEIGLSKVDTTAKRLKQINPDCIILAKKDRLTKENISRYFTDSDIVFEAFDNVGSKRLILEYYGNQNKLIILGSGMSGASNNKAIGIKGIKENIYIVGDGVTEANEKDPPFAPRVIACASLMASVALEKVLG